MNRAASCVSSGTVVMLMLLATAQGEITPQQASEVARLGAEIDQAARLFKQERFEQSAEQVGRCQEMLVKMSQAGDAQMRTALEVAHGRLKKAHSLFAAKGVQLPPLPPLNAPDPSTTIAEGSSETGAAAEGDQSISFTKHVAPILVSRCGGCHVGRNMGEFSMATFVALMQGSENGQVLTAGKPDESLLIELIETGEMPPPRPRPVPEKDIRVLRAWIAQGATFDGPDEGAGLLDLVPEEVARAAAGPAGRGGPGGFGRGTARPTRGR